MSGLNDSSLKRSRVRRAFCVVSGMCCRAASLFYMFFKETSRVKLCGKKRDIYNCNKQPCICCFSLLVRVSPNVTCKKAIAKSGRDAADAGSGVPLFYGDAPQMSMSPHTTARTPHAILPRTGLAAATLHKKSHNLSTDRL